MKPLSWFLVSSLSSASVVKVSETSLLDASIFSPAFWIDCVASPITLGSSAMYPCASAICRLTVFRRSRVSERESAISTSLRSCSSMSLESDCWRWLASCVVAFRVVLTNSIVSGRDWIEFDASTNLSIRVFIWSSRSLERPLLNSVQIFRNSSTRLLVRACAGFSSFSASVLIIGTSFSWKDVSIASPILSQRSEPNWDNVFFIWFNIILYW